MTTLTIGSGYCSINELYNRIALACSIMPKDIDKYNCTKVCVSPRIQEEVYNYYEDQKTPKDQISMWWLMFGPKAIPELTEHEVTVEDGWCKVKEATCM